jgi:hypothetical protein
VRPTDENQHSTRPNLMSSPRRGGSEESILAMLERDTTRGIGPRLSRSARAAWFGVGGVLAVGLVGAVVWMARGQPADQQAQELAMATAGVAVHSGQAGNGASGNGAAIVEEKLLAQEKEPAQAKAAVPAASGEHAAVAATGAIIEEQVAEPALPAAPATSPVPAAKPAPAVAAPAAAKHASKVARSDPAHAHAAARAAPGTASRGEKRSTVHTAMVKAKKQQAQPAAEPKVDSDVALISAVIQHASKQHTQAEPTRPCDDDNDCAAKTTPQP